MQCDHFVVKHFAGRVLYDVTGFLEKNNDSLQVRIPVTESFRLKNHLRESEEAHARKDVRRPSPVAGLARTGSRFHRLRPSARCPERHLSFRLRLALAPAESSPHGEDSKGIHVHV